MNKLLTLIPGAFLAVSGCRQIELADLKCGIAESSVLDEHFTSPAILLDSGICPVEGISPWVAECPDGRQILLSGRTFELTHDGRRAVVSGKLLKVRYKASPGVIKWYQEGIRTRAARPIPPVGGFYELLVLVNATVRGESAREDRKIPNPGIKMPKFTWLGPSLGKIDVVGLRRKQVVELYGDDYKSNKVDDIKKSSLPGSIVESMRGVQVDEEMLFPQPTGHIVVLFHNGLATAGYSLWSSY